MTVCCVQELVRCNVLFTTIRNSLVSLGQAVKGLATMSDELDAVGRALFDGKVRARNPA
jgi:dynein heavy chain